MRQKKRKPLQKCKDNQKTILIISQESENVKLFQRKNWDMLSLSL